MSKIIELPNQPRTGIPSVTRHPLHNSAKQILSFCDWHNEGQLDSDTALYLIREAAVNMVSFWEGKHADRADGLLEAAVKALSAASTAKERTKLKMAIRTYLDTNAID